MSDSVVTVVTRTKATSDGGSVFGLLSNLLLLCMNGTVHARSITAQCA